VTLPSVRDASGGSHPNESVPGVCRKCDALPGAVRLARDDREMPPPPITNRDPGDETDED
jgi:hypothetical protein